MLSSGWRKAVVQVWKEGLKEEPHTPQEINYKGDCKEQSHNCELWEHHAVAAWRVSENDFDTVVGAELMQLGDELLSIKYKEVSLTNEEVFFVNKHIKALSNRQH